MPNNRYIINRQYDNGEAKITFLISYKLKHSRPGVHQQPLVFMAYVADQKLCILTYLQEYLKRNSPVRGDHKQLLISFVKSYKPISTETISHWIKIFMTTAGGVVKTRNTGKSRNMAEYHGIWRNITEYHDIFPEYNGTSRYFPMDV